MADLNAEIIRLPGSYEDVVSESSKLAKMNEWYDANPGAANTPLQISAYAQIANEIYEDLVDADKKGKVDYAKRETMKLDFKYLCLLGVFLVFQLILELLILL